MNSWPAWVIIVDHDCMRMAAFTVEVRMIRWKIVMGMFDDIRVATGPQNHPADHTGNRKQSENRKGGCRAEVCDKPSRKRICHQPASM